jgi:unsaturated rhamnogalacturonyl hydrolase
MRRRDFIAMSALAAVGAGNLKAAEKEEGKPAKNELVEKAKMAMLCMQRASWEQGTASQALIELGEKDLVILMAKDAVLRRKGDGRFAMLGTENAVTDPASNGEAVLYAYKVTGEEKFKKAADAMYKFLMAGAPKTEKGIICHITQGRQIWSDSMFMSPPFIAVYGEYDEAVKQVAGYRECLLDKDKKLFSHIWDDQKKVFIRKDFWGGGNGWSAAGMAKIIDILPKEKEAEKQKLIGWEKDLLDGCIAYMRPDGFFHDVIDKPETFVETNLSQMLAYSIYKGVKSGWLENSYLKAADKMRTGAHSKVDKYGLVQDACSSPNFDKAGTSTEAQSFFLMMEAAYSRLSG